MIYFDIDTTTVRIPKVQNGIAYGIELVNQTTKEKINQLITVVNETSYYYDINFSRKGLIAGQYDYFVYAYGDTYPHRGKTLASGIAQYGDFSKENTEYNQPINIKTYNG